MNKAMDLRSMSFTARLGIALHCFQRYCDQKDLHHEEIDKFTDYLWEWTFLERPFMDWYKSPSYLVKVCYRSGYPSEPLKMDLSPEFVAFLRSHDVEVMAFRKLLADIVKIPSINFFGEMESYWSLRPLIAVLRFTMAEGVQLPPFSVFSNSLFKDRGGAGVGLNQEEALAWRNLSTC